MSEREPDEQPTDESDVEEMDDDVVRDIEDDPSTAGPPEEPADELRGG